LEQRMTGFEASMEQRMTGFEATITQRISGFEESMAQRMTGFEATITQRISGLETRMAALDSEPQEQRSVSAPQSPRRQEEFKAQLGSAIQPNRPIAANAKPRHRE